MSAEAEEIVDDYWQWGKDDKAPRVLHTMIRIKDVDKSLQFYCDGLGMTLLDRHDFPHANFSILFLSYAGYKDGPAALELTYNWGREEDYTHGTGYGHIAIGVPDIDAVYERLAKFGGEQVTAPKKMVPGAPKLAFVKDPDGYAIELIQTAV